MKLSGPEAERESVGGDADPSCACVALPDGDAESPVQSVYKRTKTSNTLFFCCCFFFKSVHPPVSGAHSPFQTRVRPPAFVGPTETVLVNSGQEKTQDEAKAIATAVGAKIQ